MASALEFEDDPEGSGGAGWNSINGSIQPFGSVQLPYHEAGDAPSDDGAAAAAGLEEPATAQEPSQEAQLAALLQQHQEYQDWIVHYIGGTADQLNAEGSAAAAGDDAPAEGPPVEEASVDTAAAAAASQVSGLMSCLHAGATSRAFIASLKSAADQARELERQLWALRGDRGPDGVDGEDVNAFAHAVYAAVQLLGAALYGLESAAYYEPTALATFPQLQAVSEAVTARLDCARAELQTLLEEHIADALRDVSWPPSLGGASASERSSGMPEISEDAGAASSSGGGAGGGAGFGGARSAGRGRHFPGFDLDPVRQQKLVSLLTCLTALQQAVQREAFYRLQSTPAPSEDIAPLPPPAPALWAAKRLAAPLAESLARHFAPGTATGRADRPDWLLQTVASLARDLGPLVEPLSSFLYSCGLQSHYHLAVEFAHALREIAKRLLREVRLPYLQQLATAPRPAVSSRATFSYAAAAAAASGSSNGGSPDQLPEGIKSVGELWLLLVDAIVEFEQNILPHLGAILDVDSVIDSLAEGSCMTVLCEHDEWFDAWQSAESTTVREQLEASLFSDGAWGAASSAALDAALEGPSGALPVWKREFYPPKLAEKAVGLLEHVLHRSRHIPDIERQRQFLEAVGDEVLGGVERRLSRQLDQAATFNDVLGDLWQPKVGACICAARYLSHQLTDLLSSSNPQQMRRLLPPAPTADGAAGAEGGPSAEGGAASFSSPAKAARGSVGPSPAKPNAASGRAGFSSGSWLLSQLNTVAERAQASGPGSPMRSLHDVTVLHSYSPPAPPTPPVWARQLRALGALHRDWCLRVARELAMGFGQAAVPYRRQLEAGPHSAYPTPHGDAADAGGVSPALLPALSFLRDQLGRLSLLLDSPSFRDIWRAVAVSLNRFMFNYVATEARFTQPGAAQFGVDVNGLASVLSPYTTRPAQHFRELCGAARLLTLTDDQAADVMRRMSSPTFRPNARDEPVLASLGVLCLAPQQVIHILDHRL